MFKKKSNISKKLQTYSHQRGLRWRWRRLWVVVLLGFISFGLIALGGLYWWYSSALAPVDTDSSQEVVVMIEPGTTAEEIIDILDQKELIRSSKAFRWYLIKEDMFNRLQAGTYEFTPSESAREIARKLFNGEVILQQITIVSGERLDQITQRFLDAGFAPEDIEAALSLSYNSPVLADKSTNASLEGYIYPDTYTFNRNTPVESVIAQTLRNFESKLSGEITTGLEQQGFDLHEAFTLASIIQKESSDPQLQRQIAQVFIKRLNEGIKLESDPTYRYAAAILDQPISVSIDSLYNTYRYEGLPPGPIANFEINALAAVANPSDTDYLYFVAGTDGVTRFSRTFEEHEALIEQYGVSGVE